MKGHLCWRGGNERNGRLHTGGLMREVRKDKREGTRFSFMKKGLKNRKRKN